MRRPPTIRRSRFHIYLGPTPQLFPRNQANEVRVTEEGEVRVTEEGEVRIEEEE